MKERESGRGREWESGRAGEWESGRAGERESGRFKSSLSFILHPSSFSSPSLQVLAFAKTPTDDYHLGLLSQGQTITSQIIR
jgi:hypothetical protein